jgi:hypothetical protein
MDYTQIWRGEKPYLLLDANLPNNGCSCEYGLLNAKYKIMLFHNETTAADKN